MEGDDVGGPLRVWMGPDPKIDLTNRVARLSLNPIARSHLDQRVDPQALVRRYGRLLTDYVITDLADAEVAMVPTSFEQTDHRVIDSLLAQAERQGLRTLVFASHDVEPIMGSASIILLHPGPTRGAQPMADVLATPYFLTDRAGGPIARPEGDRARVAFCGQGSVRPAAAAAQWVARATMHARNSLRARVVAPPLRSHVGLRADALRALEAHPHVECHFVIRDRYRAGAEGEAERARTQVEFDDNLRSGTYALCVRGTGNFSARFYEALSFGRIPVVVDTDGVLPCESQIDWRSRCVWVGPDEVRTMGDLVATHHHDGDPEGLRTSTALRDLWEQHLTEDGFFHHLVADVRRLL